MIVRELSETQRLAVDAWQRPVLVTAPVGTGKTMALAERAAAAIAGGVSPERMLCLSFTNRAAREVGERLQNRVQCATFHALCSTILRGEAESLGLPGDFVIYDEEDATELCGRLAKKFELEVPQMSNRVRFAIWQALSAARMAKYEQREPRKAKDVFAEELLKSGIWPAYRMPELNYAAMVTEYVALLRESHAVDFTDLVLGVVTRWEENPESLAFWQRKYEWIQVDEVQDTSRAEYRILDALGREHRQLSFFGDVDQTIYEWRGSAPTEILQAYQRDYAPLVIHFVENFRSTKRILEACERVIVSHPQALTTRIVPMVAAEGEPVLVKKFGSAQEEYAWIADSIRGFQESDAKRWSDFAVLVRTNFTARDVSEALEQRQIPHVRVEEEKFFQRAEIKTAIAHLRILRNSYEANALHRFLQTPPKGIGEMTLQKLAALPKQAGLRLGDLLRPETFRNGEPFGALLRLDTVVMDTETTGLDVESDEVVELAALKGGVEFYRLIRPSSAEHWRRLEETSRIHGVTRERVEAEGMDAATAYADFAAFVKGCVVVGHNLEAYDWPLLLRHSGLDFEIAGTADTLDISRRMLRLPRYKLESIVEALGLPKREAHRAMEDVRMTVDVLEVLQGKLRGSVSERMDVVAVLEKRFVELADQVSEWRKRCRRQTPLESLDMVLREGMIREHFSREENSEERLEHIEELRRIVGRTTTLDQALELASLGLDLERQLGEDDRVRILTVHQAKGLEFDTIFVAKTVDGEYPSWRSIREGRLDEEHRLFYVAVSRARRRLCVSWQMRDASGRAQSASRYLAHLS